MVKTKINFVVNDYKKKVSRFFASKIENFSGKWKFFQENRNLKNRKFLFPRENRKCLFPDPRPSGFKPDWRRCRQNWWISPYFRKISFGLNYVFCFPLFWPWCIQASWFTRTGRPWQGWRIGCKQKGFVAFGSRTFPPDISPRTPPRRKMQITLLK